MHEIIDVPADVGEFAERLAQAGVRTVIRYYNHSNSSRLPTKCLTRPELQALHAAGMSVATVFEQRGGAGGNITDLDADSGGADAARALALAGEMTQPEGSAIYFAVDSDYFRRSELDQIAGYFQRAKSTLGGKYLLGVYGSGTVGRHLQKLGLVDHVWLAGALGWSGTRDALQEGSWTLFQKQLETQSEIGGFSYDGNVFNPSHPNFGQFGADGVRTSPRGEGAAALFQVAARSSLNLRTGPGENFEVLRPIPNGTVVTGRGLEGPWMKVDLEGDGQVDGFMFARFLAAVSGGLADDPNTVPSPSGPGTPRRPIDFARAELMRHVQEAPGSANNPRIVMYHGTTEGGAAPDETAWCSSFVNYCVEKAGFQGTDSKWAMSWHEEGWGRDVTAAPEEGDIAVFRRRAGSSTGAIKGGHVGFFIGRDSAAGKIQVLGGNQSQRVRISSYPMDGVLGPFHYKLLSIRRG